MAPSNVLVYVLRRDLRLADNPVFHELSGPSSTPYTHLLPIYVFAAQQIETSGFIPKESHLKSPYPEARSSVGGFWRCGPHRATFLAESVWDLKQSLEKIGSGLDIKVGMLGEVVKNTIEHLKSQPDVKIGGVWMTNEEGQEEAGEEEDVRKQCENQDVNFKVFTDEKYFIDDRDVPFDNARDLPDVFTTYRKMVEPLREAPRKVLPTPTSLPPFPAKAHIPSQHKPFDIPSTFEDLKSCLLAPIPLSSILSSAPATPTQMNSAHPFRGGETSGHNRISHLISSGSMTSYKATRNGLLGPDFSTKLSAWLALGCITARQVHTDLMQFEDGEDEAHKEAAGFGKGENDGTKAVRFELLWRDYMRLCTRKFGPLLFRISGFRQDDSPPWRYPTSSNANKETKAALDRFLVGTTGMGLIDASQRELFFTGYTSNRARQNVASFLAKHLHIDWRLGAEFYECMLVDYDLSSNWGNWQYVAGVGNDPRGEKRVFNPVKQSWDYDGRGEYVLTWVKELADANGGTGEGRLKTNELFQAWEIPEDRRHELGLDGEELEMVNHPLERIHFTVGKRGSGGSGGGGGGPSSGNRQGAYRGRSRQTGGEKGMGPGKGQGRGGHYGGSGYGSGGGGGYNGRGYNGGGGRGRGGQKYAYRDGPGGGGREARTGAMEKADAARDEGDV